MPLHPILILNPLMAAGGDMLKIDLDLKKITQKLDGLAKASQEAVRPAAQAGAQVFYDRARAEAPISEKAHIFNIEGRKYGPFKPGNLRDSIYQVFSKKNSADGKATYHVSFNHTKAPYGFMVLRGVPQVPANDFIGRAYDATHKEAAQAASARLKSEIKKVL